MIREIPPKNSQLSLSSFTCWNMMSSCFSIIKEPEGILKAGKPAGRLIITPRVGDSSWPVLRLTVSGVQTPFPQPKTTLKRSDISILVTSHTHRKPAPPTATEGSKTAQGQQRRVDQQAKPSVASQVSTPHKKTGCPRLEEGCQIRELTLKPARSVTFTETRTKSKHKRNSQSHRRKESQPNSP